MAIKAGQVRQRGFALLLTLWSLVLLALLTTQLTSAARTELQLASNLRAAAVIEAQADGLIYSTIFRLMNSAPSRRGVDGLPHETPVPGGQAAIRVSSLAGKVNPNTASEPLLATLMQQVGAPEQQAAEVAAAIADWRTPGQRPRPHGAKAAQYSIAGRPYAPPGAPFETIEELRLVLGMTPDLLGRLMPHLTVFYPGDPVFAAADPVVARVLRSLDAGNDESSAEGVAEDGVYAEIDVRIAGSNGLSFSRRAIVWAGHGAQRGRYRLLQWDAPLDD